ncbi:MAG: NAD-dependent epimerase/dehydratase family protein [Verrucomicrobiota bacterium]
MNMWTGRPVTITGGAGFIGSNLAKVLVRRGARVRIADNLERGRLENIVGIKDQVEFLPVDLRRPDAARDSLNGAEVVLHLAAQVGGIKVYLDKAGSVLNNNLLIDQNVFAAAVALKTPYIFYASSAHVYPRRLQQSPEALPLREEDADPADPVLTYGWGKRIGEITLLNLAAECPWMKVAIARIMGAYGYNQDIALETGSVIPVFCHRAIIWPRQAPFRIWGTGRETRSYVFIDDVVEGILQSVVTIDSRKMVGPFNLAAEGRVTIRQIAEQIIGLSGKNIPIEFDEAATTSIWGQAADCALAAKLLNGWSARVSLRDGLERTYRHIHQHIESFADANRSK